MVNHKYYSMLANIASAVLASEGISLKNREAPC